MAFGDFNLRGAIETFGLQEDRDTDLFAQVAPLEVSSRELGSTSSRQWR
jgi:hypothetical protein